MTRKAKTEKILVLSPYGKFLGYCNMSFVVKHKGKEKKVPMYKVGEIVLQSGNSVSVGALASAGFWGVDVLVMTASGRPVSTMVSLDDYSHVKTRLAQYEAYNDEKRISIARKFVYGKVKAQSLLLEKYDLKPFDKKPMLESVFSCDSLQRVEARFSDHYFKEVFGLFPKFLQVNNREGYRAFDGLNNLLNFGYEFLRWKVFRALIKAKLEPFLGFLHRVDVSRPSLVCDFQELYRCLIDDFLIKFCKGLKKGDFEKYFESTRYKRKYPRVYLKHGKTNVLVEGLSDFFGSRVDVATMRNRGKSQTLNTLLSQEASLFAMFLRGEKSEWKPRVVVF